jgi:lipopolysaccharide/colanic/teichoic acid biosynthesis glycosyltransferase
MLPLASGFTCDAPQQRRDVDLLSASEDIKQEIVPAGNRSISYQVAKRVIDIIGAAAILLCLAPAMVVTWVVLVWTTRGRPIFVQQRVGYLGKTFSMYKFRTMVLGAAARQRSVANHREGPIFKNFNDPRVTRIGRVLRSLSIDETPQLFNVLRGQMSLVGPRPALAHEVRQYKAWQRKRLAVKPGLTCLWQVSGRSEIGFDDWMRMDAWYLRHQSLWTDLKLLACTPWCVLSRRGAY